MTTLADFLGAYDPEEDRQSAKTAPPANLSRREFARQILNSEQYRQSVLDRIRLGTLPPQVEIRLYDYAYGKPADHVKLEDNTQRRLEDLNEDQLEKRMRLLHAEKMRRLHKEGESEASVH